MPLSQANIQGKYLKTITTACLDRYNTYFEDDVAYKGLKNRCGVIDDAIDLRFRENEAFISEIAPPVVRKDYYETNAFLQKYFENDPVVHLENLGSTPKINADNLQVLLNLNFKNTRYREECLLWLFDNLARYGSAVCFSQFDANYRGVGLQTSYNSGAGATPYPRTPVTGKNAVVNYSIHPLNYFCDPRANSMTRKFYEGFIDQWYVADLFGYVNNPMYIQETLLQAIEACKKGHSEAFWYGGVGNETKDHTRASANVIRMYTMLNFDGNETDRTVYYCELVANKLIRCHPNDTDFGIVPLQTGVYIPRPDVWWGNSSVDMKIPFQNLKNWLINAKVEDVMKASDRIILTRRGSGLDVADINNRHQFGGIVFYEGNENPQNLMYPVQFQSKNAQDFDWLNREINQMIQETSPVVNMQNKYNQGGMNNNTLGAVQMQASLGEVLYGYVMKNVGYLLERTTEVNAVLILQNMGDSILLKKSPNAAPIDIAKHEMLGEFCYKAKSTFFLNDKTERVDKANVINQILNWKATQQPDFQSLTMAPFIKDFVRAWVGQGADLSEYIQAPQPPQIQSPGTGGAPPQNPGPQPGQQPPSAPPAAPQEQMVYPKRYLTPAPARPQ
jgi:hypothetical protein